MEVTLETPLSKPSEGSAGITGYWRTFKPVINKSKCVKCLLCWIYCPEGTIIRINDNVDINYVYCKGCGICVNECPAKAIDMVLEGEYEDCFNR